jgi:D-alanine transaminase
MSRIAYVNGDYVAHGRAAVHIEDRGYQFADGVYEVIAVNGGAMIDGDGHMRRLQYSLDELEIAMPMSPRALAVVIAETIRRNRIHDGIVYLQITRGSSPRNHPFPDFVRPALVITARRAAFPTDAEGVAGGHVITIPDIRWSRCDIKTVSLLPAVLAKQQAVEADAYEAWMIDGDGYITEGSSTNAWIVDQHGRLVTRPKSHAILGGITRETVLRLAAENGIEVIERPFTLEEAVGAREAFLTSTTSLVKPITRIDEHAIANGEPGQITLRLLKLYIDYMKTFAA